MISTILCQYKSSSSSNVSSLIFFFLSASIAGQWQKLSANQTKQFDRAQGIFSQKGKKCFAC
jgi:hypothetical protein